MASNCNAECEAVIPNLAPCGGVSMTSAAVDCNPCAEANCCDQLSASGESYDWYARRNCIAQCDDGDDACIQACTEAYPNGLALDLWLTSCTQTSCAVECEVDPAPVCGNPYLGDPAESCPVCVEANCCAEEQACWSSLACLQNGICSELCEGDASCLAACDTEHAAGVALSDADDACVDTNCATECAGM